MAIRFTLLVFLLTLIYSKAELCNPKELQMTLYFHDYYSGPNATTIEVTNKLYGHPNFKKFGAMFVTDNHVAEDLAVGSAQVARAQGLFFTSALDGSTAHVLISIVFTNDEYQGTTLEIQGTSSRSKRVREMAIVGGSGKFRLSHGYATFETMHYDPSIYYEVIRCNVTVLHYESCSTSYTV